MTPASRPKVRLALLLAGGVAAMGALGLVVVVVGYEALEARYQADADARRIRDVKHLAELVRRYHATVGTFPLAQRGYALPVAVDLIPGGAPHDPADLRVRPGTVVPVEELVAELRDALGSDVVIPRDPQRAAYRRPNWYQYEFNGSTAFVAANLASEAPGARKVAEHYYKLEIEVLPSARER